MEADSETGEAAPADAIGDVALVDAMARGDVEALSRLYARYGGAAHSLARFALGEAAAPRVVLDAFETLWHGAGRFDAGGASPRTWLFALVRSGIARERGRSRALPTAASAHANDAQPQAVADAWPEAWTRRSGAIVRAALTALPRERRMALEACAFGGLSVAEAAASTGVTVDAVKRRLRVAVARVRAQLDAGAPDPR